MKLRNMTLAGIILLAIAFSANTGAAQTNTADDVNLDNIEPYKGPIGPDHPLYPFKLALESVDESFTFNKVEKIRKQVAHLELRLAETKAAYGKSNNDAASRAMGRYEEKMQEAETLISEIDDTDSGLLNAREMIRKHDATLEGLRSLHPDNKGIERALENRKKLEEKFMKKLENRKGDKEADGFDASENPIKIKAKIIGNDTQIEVKVYFKTNSTDNITIAQDIWNRLQLSEENISRIIKIENVSENKNLTESLEAQADVKKNASIVRVEYMFPVNKSNETEIIDGVYVKLSELSIADILDALEMKIKVMGINKDEIKATRVTDAKQDRIGEIRETPKMTRGAKKD